MTYVHTVVHSISVIVAYSVCSVGTLYLGYMVLGIEKRVLRTCGGLKNAGQVPETCHSKAFQVRHGAHEIMIL